MGVFKGDDDALKVKGRRGPRPREVPVEEPHFEGVETDVCYYTEFGKGDGSYSLAKPSPMNDSWIPKGPRDVSDEADEEPGHQSQGTSESDDNLAAMREDARESIQMSISCPRSGLFYMR